MKDASADIPQPIERGLLSLRGLSTCTVTDGPTLAGNGKWMVTLSIRRPTDTPFIAAMTRWCLLIDSCYPVGTIAIHPASTGGITATFPHQSRNTPSYPPQAWRNGNLCLSIPTRGAQPFVHTSDPVGDADTRMLWHVERAHLWLQRAANDQLMAAGDPFELPARPIAAAIGAWEKKRVVHDESSASLSAWQARGGAFGILSLGAVQDIAHAIGVARYADRHGATIRAWGGRNLSDLSDFTGFWWLWPKPIVLEPWEAPATWGQLRQAAKTQGLDVDTVLRWILPNLRGLRSHNILLVGYPVADSVGEPPTEIHWDTLALPPVPAAEGKPPNGFRPNLAGWWQRDRHGTFADALELKYLPTENWGPHRLQARGRLPARVRDLRIALIGVGALGSMFAEMLVRAGLSNIALVDGESLRAGNVCRHTGTLADVGTAKVKVVAQRLRQVSPMVRVTENGDALEGSPASISGQLDDYDAIIDCTASDEALMALASAWWSIPRIFASFSLGYGARRIYSFGSYGHSFPCDDFAMCVRPWIQHETKAWTQSGETFEGAGCWSPIFPARNDDVALAAAICVKELVQLVTKKIDAYRFRVFSQTMSDDGFESFAIDAARPGIDMVNP